MAGILVDLGEIWELRLHGKLAEQQTITIQHLRVTALTPPVSVVALNNALQVATKVAGGFGFQALPALPSNWAGIDVSCQRVFPTEERTPNSSSAWDVTGAAGNADTANVAQCVTRRTQRAGRSEISTGHLPCPTIADAIIAGELTPDQKTALTGWLGSNVLDKVLIGGAVTLSPVIWHRGVPLAGRYFSLITEAVIQETVRTMRRRTVGRGI